MYSLARAAECRPIKFLGSLSVRCRVNGYGAIDKFAISIDYDDIPVPHRQAAGVRSSQLLSSAAGRLVPCRPPLPGGPLLFH
eukprot:1175400-Prorocentrum_minimum.AAC.3